MAVVSSSLTFNSMIVALNRVTAVLFPLITYPYVSRILDVEGLGKFNFSASVVNYYILLAGLGVAAYAIREGSKIKGNKEQLLRFISEVFTLNIYSTILSYLALFGTLYYVDGLHKYTSIILILSFEIIFSTLGIEWLYSVQENFLFMVVRSFLVRITMLLGIFLLVKNSSDLLIYATIMMLANALGNIANYVVAKREFNFRILGIEEFPNIVVHLKPVAILFGVDIATMVYGNSDITMLGFLCGDAEVGLYSISVKVYSVVNAIIASVVFVSYPRISHMIGDCINEQVVVFCRDLYEVLITVTFPIATIMVVMSKDIILLVGGEHFFNASSSLMILSLLLVVNVMNWFYTRCVIIPYQNDSLLLRGSIVGAMLNVLLNLVFLQSGGQNAAALSSLFVESMLVIVYRKKAKEYVSFPQGGIHKNGILGCVYIVLLYFAGDQFNFEGFSYDALFIICATIGYILIQLVLKNRILTNKVNCFMEGFCNHV